MRTVKLSDLMGRSFDRTVEILFKPFSFKKWLRLLLIAFLAGALVGGSGSGGGRNGSSTKKEASQVSGQQVSPVNGQAAGATAGTIQPASVTSQGRTSENTPKAFPYHIVAAIVAGVLAVLVISFIILITWIGSRFRFIWFNAVANNVSSISEPYARHAAEANSLFRFSMALLLFFVLFVIACVAWTIFLMHAHGVFSEGFKWSLTVGLKIFMLPAILLIVTIISLIILAFVIDSFAVPIMAFDRSSLGAALKKFASIFGSNRGDIVIFMLLVLLLALLSSGCVMALGLALLILILIVAAIVFGIPFLVIWALMKAKLVYIIYAVTVGIPFVIIGLITITAAGLPFAVFFRLLSLNYLISLNCGYSQVSLDEYSKRRAVHISKTAPIMVVVTLFIIGFVFIGGILAAIAIPNFIRARDNAVKMQKPAIVQAQGTALKAQK